jgi:hypothetical protein
MFSLLNLLVIGLAVWRVSHMLKYEAGPWDILIRIRERLGDSMLGRMMDCMKCSSVWLAIIFSVPGTKYIVIVLAISSLAIMFEEIYGLLRKAFYISCSGENDHSGISGTGSGL